MHKSLGDKTSSVSEKEAGRFFTIYAYAHAQIDFLAIAADVDEHYQSFGMICIVAAHWSDALLLLLRHQGLTSCLVRCMAFKASFQVDGPGQLYECSLHYIWRDRDAGVRGKIPSRYRVPGIMLEFSWHVRCFDSDSTLLRNMINDSRY